MTSSSARRLRHTRRVIPGEQAGSLSAPSLLSPADELSLPFDGPHVDGAEPDPFEETRRRAFDEGYRAALEAAARQEEDRQEAARVLAEQVAEVATRVARERRAIVDEAVADAVDLALELLGVLLGREIEQSEVPARDALVRALSLAPEGEDLVVRLPPGSHLAEEEVRRLAPTARVSVVEDPSVEANGCVVDAGRCRIDAQLSPALERVRRQFESVRHPQDERGGAR